MFCETHKCDDHVTIPKKYNKINEVYLVISLSEKLPMSGILSKLYTHIDCIIFKINSINLYNIRVEWLILKEEMDLTKPNGISLTIPLNISVPLNNSGIRKLELETRFKTDAIDNDVDFDYIIEYDLDHIEIEI